MSAERQTCPVCNGHGFTILVQDFDYCFKATQSQPSLAVVGETRRGPTDLEAESDLSDLSPRQCHNRCFFGTVPVQGVQSHAPV